jgi:WD40 repeat protein
LRAQVLDLGSVMFGMCKEYALAGHTQRVLALCVGAGNLLFSGGLDAQVRVWDLSSMACVQTIADHEHAVTGVALADDGKRPAAESKGKFLCTCSYDTTVRVFRPVPRASAEGARLSSASSAVSTNAPSSRGATPSGRPRSRSPAAGGKGERASPFAPGACDWWVPHRVLRGSAVYVHAIATRGKHIWSAGEDGLLKQWCAARACAPVRARWFE